MNDLTRKIIRAPILIDERWNEAATKVIEGLKELQTMQATFARDYAEWSKKTPDDLRDTPPSEKLRNLAGFDIDRLVDIAEEIQELRSHRVNVDR
jgi:hypothetical protein